MNYLADGGGAGQVAITIERVEAIARQTMSAMESSGTSSTQSFRDLSVGQGAYGGVPLAQAFGTLHDEAHAVFLTTIQGVLADLRDFQANLLACAQNHRTSDEAVAASMTAMTSRYRGHRFHADANYQHALKEQGQTGHHPTEGSAATPGTTAAAPSGSGGSASMPATSAPDTGAGNAGTANDPAQGTGYGS